MVRGYYYDDGKEITHWFAQEQEFATSFYSFITSSPALENVETLEETEVVKISNAALQHLYKTFQETERLGKNYYRKLLYKIRRTYFKSSI